MLVINLVLGWITVNKKFIGAATEI